MKTAYMFSGQGSQYAGMGKELYNEFPECKQIFEAASGALGFSISDICFHDEEKLNKTEYTQPAILTASIAAYKLVKMKKPDYMLGLSLGEYSALTAAGVLDFNEAVTLVRKRGKLMADACPPGTGCMSAVLNLSRELVIQSCEEARGAGIVSPANFNMPGQIVIAGEAAAVEKAEKIALSKGAKRCMRLNVNGAFHTEMLKGAAEKLEEELEKTRINGFDVPVLTNLTGSLYADKADVRQTLVKQVMSPVMWEDSINRLFELGVETFVEIGCGKTLTGFVKKIANSKNKEVKLFNIEDLKSYRQWEGAAL